MTQKRVIHYVCACCKNAVTVTANFVGYGVTYSDADNIARFVRILKRSPLLCEPCAEDLGVDFLPRPDGYRRKV